MPILVFFTLQALVSCNTLKFDVRSEDKSDGNRHLCCAKISYHWAKPTYFFRVNAFALTVAFLV